MARVRIKMSLEGSTYFRRNLKYAERRANDEVEDIVHDVADFIKDKAIEQLWKKPNRVTGQLIDEGLTVEGSGKDYTVTASAINPKDGKDYAGFVEFGTSRSRAYPYMAPAQILGEKELNKRINKLARELGKKQ
jgi:hypothetical protein